MHRSVIFLNLTIVLAMATASCGDDNKPARPDSSPPVVTLTEPVDGVAMIGPRSLPFQAQATDDTGVTRVEFLFDDVVVGQDTSGTGDLRNVYDYTWQNPPISVGRHRAAARAHDVAGNTSEAVASITIIAADTTRPATAPMP